MRICYFGNAQSIHTKRWARYFANKGHKVAIISDRFASIPGIKVYNYNYPPRTKKWLASLQRIFRIKKAIKEFRPDIIHAQGAASGARHAARTKIHPFFVQAWGSEILGLSGFKPGLRKKILRALKQADLITLPGQHMKDVLLKYKELDPNKLVIFQYGIDTSLFQPVKKDSSKTKVVVSTRHLGPLYSVETLIRAVSLIIKKFNNVRFTIVGTGPRKRYLESLANKLQVSNFINFVGSQLPAKVAYYLQQSDIYVSASLSDGASLSLMEAMACGSFPIVTDIPANRNWIENGKNGFLVSVDNPRDLADKIILALNNLELCKKAVQDNLNLIRKKYNFSDTMEYIETLHRDYLRDKIRVRR